MVTSRRSGQTAAVIPPDDGTRARLLESWISRLDTAGVLMAPRAAVTAELEGWLELLTAAGSGDQASHFELQRLVALHGRALGADGKPASAALLQGILLEDTLAEVVGLPHRLSPITRELLRIIADAHALGASQSQAARAAREMREAAPVFPLGTRAVIGFLLGECNAEGVDAIFGRVLRACVGVGAKTAVIDLSGAGPDTGLFHRTLDGFTKTDSGGTHTLIVTGLRNADATRAAVRALGTNLDRIVLESAPAHVVIAQLLLEFDPTSP